MTDHEDQQPDQQQHAEILFDRPLTEQDAEDIIAEQQDREERPHRTLTDREREEQVEHDATAVLTFGPDCWPAAPPDPDES